MTMFSQIIAKNIEFFRHSVKRCSSLKALKKGIPILGAKIESIIRHISEFGNGAILLCTHRK